MSKKKAPMMWFGQLGAGSYKDMQDAFVRFGRMVSFLGG